MPHSALSLDTPVNSSAPTYLLVGGDGFIATHLTAALSKSGVNIIATSRRANPKTDGTVRLDLRHQHDFQIPDSIDVAIICAGISGFDICHDNPMAEDINTNKIPSLAMRLLQRGVFTLYLSSNVVFDSSAVFPKEIDRPNPDTNYGRQKRICELRMSEYAFRHGLSDLLSIVRLTKVVSFDREPFLSWYVNWKSGVCVPVFGNVYFCPLGVTHLCNSMESILRRRLPGLYHLSGETSVSYLHFCTLLVSSLFSKKCLVTATTKKDEPLYGVNGGGLSMDFTSRITGCHPQKLSDLVSDLALTVV